jgi:hypothetical protein
MDGAGLAGSEQCFLAGGCDWHVVQGMGNRRHSTGDAGGGRGLTETRLNPSERRPGCWRPGTPHSRTGAPRNRAFDWERDGTVPRRKAGASASRHPPSALRMPWPKEHKGGEKYLAVTAPPISSGDHSNLEGGCRRTRAAVHSQAPAQSPTTPTTARLGNSMQCGESDRLRCESFCLAFRVELPALTWADASEVQSMHQCA